MVREIFEIIMETRLAFEWNIISILLAWSVIGNIIADQFKEAKNWKDYFVQFFVMGPVFWIYAIFYSVLYATGKALSKCREVLHG